MSAGPFAAFAYMDEHGFLPPHDCKRCGQTLRGMGTGYPAELYTGTYTGLCYPCNDRPPELVKTYTLDGAQCWDFPPAMPSYRRYRESHVGYPDCPACKGRGVVNWEYHMSGTPYKSCDACTLRYDGHVLRKRYHDALRRIFEMARERFERGVWLLVGVNEHTPRKVRDAACGRVSKEDAERLSAEAWDWYHIQQRKLLDAAHARGTFD